MVKRGKLIPKLIGKYSLEALKESPIFGVGTGDHINYIKNKIIDYKYPEPMLNILNGGENANLHSDYLDIFVQFGFIGLLIFLNIFYQIVRYKTENEHLKAALASFNLHAFGYADPRVTNTTIGCLNSMIMQHEACNPKLKNIIPPALPLRPEKPADGGARRCPEFAQPDQST